MAPLTGGGATSCGASGLGAAAGDCPGDGDSSSAGPSTGSPFSSTVDPFPAAGEGAEGGTSTVVTCIPTAGSATTGRDTCCGLGAGGPASAAAAMLMALALSATPAACIPPALSRARCWLLLLPMMASIGARCSGAGVVQLGHQACVAAGVVPASGAGAHVAIACTSSPAAPGVDKRRLPDGTCLITKSPHFRQPRMVVQGIWFKVQFGCGVRASDTVPLLLVVLPLALAA